MQVENGQNGRNLQRRLSSAVLSLFRKKSSSDKGSVGNCAGSALRDPKSSNYISKLSLIPPGDDAYECKDSREGSILSSLENYNHYAEPETLVHPDQYSPTGTIVPINACKSDDTIASLQSEKCKIKSSIAVPLVIISAVDTSAIEEQTIPISPSLQSPAYLAMSLETVLSNKESPDDVDEEMATTFMENHSSKITSPIINASTHLATLKQEIRPAIDRHQLWVPAYAHPEVNPADFKSWISARWEEAENQVQVVQRKSSLKRNKSFADRHVVVLPSDSIATLDLATAYPSPLSPELLDDAESKSSLSRSQSHHEYNAGGASVRRAKGIRKNGRSSFEGNKSNISSLDSESSDKLSNTRNFHNSISLETTELDMILPMEIQSSRTDSLTSVREEDGDIIIDQEAVLPDPSFVDSVHSSSSDEDKDDLLRSLSFAGPHDDDTILEHRLLHQSSDTQSTASKKKKSFGSWLFKFVSKPANVKVIAVAHSLKSSATLPEISFDDEDILYPDTDPVEFKLHGDSRFSLDTEKNIYRLSHGKVADRSRSLYEQVMISNLMMYIISVHADVTLDRAGRRAKRGRKSGGSSGKKRRSSSRERMNGLRKHVSPASTLVMEEPAPKAQPIRKEGMEDWSAKKQNLQHLAFIKTGDDKLGSFEHSNGNSGVAKTLRISELLSSDDIDEDDVPLGLLRGSSSVAI